MKRRQPSAAVNMVERALIAHEWRANVATARIHALMGENPKALVNQAGRVFFVVLGAAMQQQLHEDQREIRIIRGAVNAVHDQAGVEPIDPMRRASILAGLETAVQLLAALPYPAIVQSACDLAAKLRRQDIRLEDLVLLVGRRA
ncbi:hypothetical protein RCH27_08480 [Paracidovorax citrulli]|uniref:hypothetical protein n=1 Tax=Paracidovorax citrulli TaxID=80869 RepID=UPI003A7FE1EA